MAYMAMVNTRDSTQEVVKIWDTTKHTAINWQGLAGAQTLALDKLEKKEAVVPKEFKHPRRQYIAVGLQGCCYVRVAATTHGPPHENTPKTAKTYTFKLVINQQQIEANTSN